MPADELTADQAGFDELRRAVHTRSEGFLADLEEWLRIPSVSADPAHAADVVRSAEWLAAALRRTGFPTVEIWPTPGHPAVFAEWPADRDDAPTVLVYGHHDVQPPGDPQLWSVPAFEPARRGEELFGRGSADDKGQVAFHLLAIDALRAVNGSCAPPVRLLVLVEGEEEIGSPNFRDLLERQRHRLSCDTVVVSDTPMYARDVPSICTGMRGLVYAQIDLHGPDVELHSGSFGGAVPNPATVLARLLAGLHDSDGRVTLPGFYDRVEPPTERERELYARLPFSESAFLDTAASRATAGERGFTTLERIWTRPTCEVNGLWGGYTGPGQKTVVPTDAHAKISFRLVHDQRPAEVAASLREVVTRAVPPGIEARVTVLGDGVRPSRTPLDAPALLAAVRALERVYGREIAYTREGGSGPEADLAEVLDAPVVFLGVGLPEDRIHAPDERVLIPQLLAGAEAAARLWGELAGPIAASSPR